MSLIKTLKRNENALIIYDNLKDLYYRYLFTDKRLIQKKYKRMIGKDVELENPIEFNDKLQWLKLYWYNPVAEKCADKYEVRAIIKDIIGEKYLNKLYGVYESVDDINIDDLPRSFVLKGTNGSGFNIVCHDKNEIDWDKMFKRMNRWLKKNYYWRNREWVYKNIKPRIICEKYLSEGNNQSSLTDYKFFCFNGNVEYCQVIRDRGANETIDFYDREWNHMPFTGLRPLPNSKQIWPKPSKYSEMLYLAECLSRNFPFVRVDFYFINEEIIFGELTFFPQSGFGSFYPVEWNKKIGEKLVLDKK